MLLLLELAIEILPILVAHHLVAHQHKQHDDPHMMNDENTSSHNALMTTLDYYYEELSAGHAH